MNQTVHVPCLVTGKPEVEISWYWNSARVLNNGKTLKIKEFCVSSRLCAVNNQFVIIMSDHIY